MDLIPALREKIHTNKKKEEKDLAWANTVKDEDDEETDDAGKHFDVHQGTLFYLSIAYTAFSLARFCLVV